MYINASSTTTDFNKNNTSALNVRQIKPQAAASQDTAVFSGKSKTEKPEPFYKNILNLLYKKPKINPQSLEKAQNGFAAYQYQSGIINSALRNSTTTEDAVKILKKLSRELDGGDELEAYFVEKGFDILSEPLKEDTTVYRYIFSNDDYNADWQTGDKITEKGFLSATSDNSDNSYAKNYVRKCLKQYNNYAANKGKFYTLEINIPKGTKVVKGNDGMNEILLKNGSSFTVTDFNPETNYYKCKLL